MISSMWAEEDGSVIGYMCATDWECELGAASGGNTIFPSVGDLKSCKPCVEACGIVEVKVSFRSVVSEGSDDD